MDAAERLDEAGVNGSVTNTTEELSAEINATVAEAESNSEKDVENDKQEPLMEEDGQMRLFSEGNSEKGTEVKTAAQRIAMNITMEAAERLKKVGVDINILSSQEEARRVLGGNAEYSKRTNSALNIEWHSAISSNMIVNKSLLTTSIFHQSGAFISDELKDVEYPEHKTVYSVALCSGNWYFYSVDENYDIEVFDAIEGVDTRFNNVIEKVYEYGINRNANNILGIMQEYAFSERVSRGILDHIERRAIEKNNGDNGGFIREKGESSDSVGTIGDNTQRVNAGYFFRGFPREVGEYAQKWGVDNFRAAEMYYIMQKSKDNGTFMKAPNGKHSNLDEKQWLQVRTRDFKSWFGDWENDPDNASKIVDKNGEPLVVYHGSNVEFDAFDFKYFRRGRFGGESFSFTPKKEIADSYADGKVYEVFLNLRELDKAPSNRGDEWVVKDGVIRYDYNDKVEDAVEIAVRRPNQIKSATNNSGAFRNSDNRFKFSTSDGIVYGWAEGNTITLTPEGINPNTPVHEYTHLWSKAVQKNNPALWERCKELAKT